MGLSIFRQAISWLSQKPSDELADAERAFYESWQANRAAVASKDTRRMNRTRRALLQAQSRRLAAEVALSGRRMA